ncbi:unnamed protein product [Fraxinus pennsylvanica]|uniref:U-box domain-containing protein n=1 Tax=Fraxinus pennsylvanica TaxID=56036 RepID=A0AAD2EA79_9LAMI|nr:unnamed protein product [Fraxinus pennsylvanica]
MKDPVTISSGITYDRESIEKWMFSRNKSTCPVTRQVISDSELTPNITVRRLIQSWCILHASHGIERYPTPKAPISKPQLLKIFKDAKSPQMQLKCLQRLKSIAFENETNKICMEKAGTAEFLASLIIVKKIMVESSIEESEDLFESARIRDEALSILAHLQLSESSLKSLLRNNEIMKDPVTISSGITYDRESIEKWMFSRNKSTCPVTRQVISDSELTPNITVRRLIQSWCVLHASHGIERYPTPKAPISKPQLLKIFKDAKSPQMQLKCLQRLKSIAFENETNKICMEKAGTAEFLASLIIVKKIMVESSIEESEDLSESARIRDEALSILVHLQLSESSLKSLLRNNGDQFIESLTHTIQRGSYESSLSPSSGTMVINSSSP